MLGGLISTAVDGASVACFEMGQFRCAVSARSEQRAEHVWQITKIEKWCRFTITTLLQPHMPALLCLLLEAVRAFLRHFRPTICGEPGAGLLLEWLVHGRTSCAASGHIAGRPPGAGPRPPQDRRDLNHTLPAIQTTTPTVLGGAGGEGSIAASPVRAAVPAAAAAVRVTAHGRPYNNTVCVPAVRT